MSESVCAPDPMTPRVVRVRRRRRDVKGVYTLSLGFDEGEDFSFSPGQFNMLTAFGVGEAPISISGVSADGSELLHTIRDVGAVSGALARLGAGDSLGLRGPFGAGWPVEAAKGGDVIFIAGGLGLAPLRPAIRSLIADRKNFGRVSLLYGVRHPGDALFPEEFESWRERSDLAAEITVDHAGADWRGHVGVVTTLIDQVAFDPARTTAFVCGPEIMMRFAIAALGDMGLADHAIYLSMERSMKCAVGFCGHCQLGPFFVCRDGPVFRYDRLRALMAMKEL